MARQNLYTLHLSFVLAQIFQMRGTSPFGVRKITYAVPGTDTLTISVNGVPVFIRGGDWGLDEAMKRIPRERLDAEIRLHKLANLNLIRQLGGSKHQRRFLRSLRQVRNPGVDEFFRPSR